MYGRRDLSTSRLCRISKTAQRLPLLRFNADQDGPRGNGPQRESAGGGMMSGRPRPWENVSAEAAGALYPAGVGAETPIDRLARVT